MAISRKIIAQNIVLVTNGLNVNSFSQYWFIKKGIFAEDDFLGDSVFTPGLALVSSQDCQLTVLPNQIQLELKSDNPEMALQSVRNRMVKLIKCLTNVRVIAIGVNFIWKLDDNERDITVLSKSLFGETAASIGSYFNKADTRYGAYYSQNVDQQTRLKLDIKPSMVKENGQTVDFMMYNFNFHCDVPEQLMEETLLDQVNKWQQFYKLANELICL